jgi:HEAT repeat protein
MDLVTTADGSVDIYTGPDAPAGKEYSIEVRLVAARALGMLGSDEGYNLAMENLASREMRTRYLAAMAVGAIARADAQGPLGGLLKDADEDVRLAAASSILQLR